ILWLVEDNAAFRELLTEMLGTYEGLNCTRQFSSAEGLLKALSEEGPPPDLILSDYQLGGMSGAEAVPLIAELAGSTRVFIMTTFFDSSKRAHALEAGADGFLVKSWCWDQNVEKMLSAAAAPRRRSSSRAPKAPEPPAWGIVHWLLARAQRTAW